MSLNQDRLTFFGVLVAVVVVVLGYLQLGHLYPTATDAAETTDQEHAQPGADESHSPNTPTRQDDAPPEG